MLKYNNQWQKKEKNLQEKEKQVEQLSTNQFTTGSTKYFYRLKKILYLSDWILQF